MRNDRKVFDERHSFHLICYFSHQWPYKQHKQMDKFQWNFEKSEMGYLCVPIDNLGNKTQISVWTCLFHCIIKGSETTHCKQGIQPT